MSDAYDPPSGPLGNRPREELHESVVQRLKSHYGRDVDPDVNLQHPDEDDGLERPERSPDEDSATSLGLVRRLAAAGSEMRYEVKREIARGGMGTILRVWDDDLRRNLAMKVLHSKRRFAEDSTTAGLDREKLGRFQGQLCTGAVQEIEIEYAGDVSSLRVAPITVAVLKGFLESITDSVNMVNASVIAQERGIKVVESKSSQPYDFASTITTKVRGCDGGERLIAGAVFHGEQPRIVRIDDFMLEAIPEGPTILIRNHDRPGVVGVVGGLLGEAGINISRMQLALVRERGEAAMLVNVEPLPDEKTMDTLRRVDNMIDAVLVDLGS